MELGTRSLVTEEVLNSEVSGLESGGGGNRTPVRRLKPGYPRVSRRRQTRGIPTMASPARITSDPRFPEDTGTFPERAERRRARAAPSYAHSFCGREYQPLAPPRASQPSARRVYQPAVVPEREV